MYCPACLLERNRKQWMNRVYNSVKKVFQRECPYCLYVADEQP